MVLLDRHVWVDALLRVIDRAVIRGVQPLLLIPAQVTRVRLLQLVTSLALILQNCFATKDILITGFWLLRVVGDSERNS